MLQVMNRRISWREEELFVDVFDEMEKRKVKFRVLETGGVLGVPKLN